MGSLGLAALITVAIVTAYAAPAADEAKEGWISLFDGKTFTGWKANENPQTAFTIENGMIVAHGTRSHLFYDGPVQNHDFKNFEFRADVMTTTGSNSGIFFHTKYQDSGWPSNGYEAQVNSSHSDPKRTGSLYNTVDKVEKAGSSLSKDGKWFRYDIIVKGKQIILKVDGKTIVDYTEPADTKPPANRPGKRLSSGTFALQAHPPVGKPADGGKVYYKNIMIKPLPE
jgi:hypothetical protein